MYGYYIKNKCTDNILKANVRIMCLKKMPPTDPAPGTVRYGGGGGSSQPHRLVQPDGFGKASLAQASTRVRKTSTMRITDLPSIINTGILRRKRKGRGRGGGRREESVSEL